MSKEVRNKVLDMSEEVKIKVSEDLRTLQEDREAREEIWEKCRSLWIAQSITGEWVIGSLFKDYLITDVDEVYCDDDTPSSLFPEFDYVQIRTETLRQCTGLCDASGILIFDDSTFKNAFGKIAKVKILPGKVALIFDNAMVTLRSSNHLEMVESDGGPSLEWMKFHALGEEWTKKLGGSI